MTETKKFKVYHSRNFALNTKLHFDTDGYAPIKENYELVAVVNCLDLEQAFYFTNHVDKAWFEHLNVEVVKESRSTSVGDLVEDEDGQLWLCAGCGWEKVEWSKDDITVVVHKDSYGEYLVPVPPKEPCRFTISCDLYGSEKCNYVNPENALTESDCGY